MEITKPLSGTGGVIVDLSQPQDLSGTVLDPEVQNNAAGGVICLPLPVLSWRQRVQLFGDGEPVVIDPTSRSPRLTQVVVPWLPPFAVAHQHVALDPITYRADNLVRTISEKPEDPVVIQRSVTKLQDEIASRLSGKSGILSRHVYSLRCANSIRFVIVAGPELPPDVVALPERAAEHAGIAEGDCVLLSRSPVLWQGSVLAMHVTLVPGNAGRLTPWCLKDVAGDHDGDSVACIKWPAGVPEPEPEEFGAVTPRLPTEVEHAAQWACTTLSPRDLFTPGGGLDRISEVIDLSSDVQAYAQGMDVYAYLEQEEQIALTLGKMKLQLGVVGSLTDKVCAVVDEATLGAALRAKEKITQALFDSKHGDDVFDVRMLSAAFENGPEAQMSGMLAKCGVRPQEAAQIASSLVAAGCPPLSDVFKDLRPDLATIRSVGGRVEWLQAFDALQLAGKTVETAS